MHLGPKPEKGAKKPFYSKENGNPEAKSALLSGPPGIGKTTLAVLVAKSLGYEVGAWLDDTIALL